MNKLWWLAVAVLLCLAACTEKPVPVVIDYPDDPRVPQGTWLIEPVARSAELKEFRLNAAADELIMRIGDETVRYGLVAGEWVEVSGGRPAGTYDFELDAYVNVRKQGGQLLVDVVNFAGETSNTVIELSEDVNPDRFRSGSGIVVGLTGTGESGTTINWWDTLTGEYQGRHEVAGHGEGMRASGDGRALVFSSLNAGRRTLFNLDSPEELLEFPMGICRSGGGGQLSSDGRWFVGSSCWGKSAVYDMNDPGSVSHRITVPDLTTVTVALDSAELVWFDEVAGNVMVADIADGSRDILHHFSADDAEYTGFITRSSDLYLNRSAGILAFNTFRGALRIVDLNDGSSELLPAFDLTGVSLELVTQPLDGAEPPFEQLNLSGSWHRDGLELEVKGFATGGNHHRYAPAELETAMLPLRPARIWLDVLDPDAESTGDTDALWLLDVSMDGPESTFYSGTLTPGTAAEPAWDIRLVRP